MSTTSFTAASVMDMSASVLNDQPKSLYSYTVQLPYLMMALRDCQMELELNNIPLMNLTSAIIPLETYEVQLNPPDMPFPVYPGDLIEIQQIWERTKDSTDAWLPLKQYEFLPHILDNIPGPWLQYWAWEQQIIKFNPAGTTTAREVKLDYLAEFLGDDIIDTTVIGIINAQNYLGFRTGQLCAQFIGENPTRATELGAEAVEAMDKLRGIGVKGRQAITTRKRPFRAGYRNRGVW